MSEDDDIVDTERPVLVVSQEYEDGHHLRRHLGDNFENLNFCDVEGAVDQWLALEPKALVLAGNSLSESERIYEELLEAEIENDVVIPHRTVVMCQLEEAEDAYDLCVDGVIDDYIVFKPLHDVWRINLCVLQALEGPARKRPTGDAADADKHGKRQRMLPTVMVFEDDPFTREVYEDILEANGYNPILVDDGSQAMIAIDETFPNVIIMDINMPGLDGIETTKQLRSDKRTTGIPIIIASGRRDKATVEACVKLGANGYVTKPINVDKLLEKIRQHLPFDRYVK